MKTILDLRVGDPVWAHASRSLDTRTKYLVFPGVVEKRAGGYLKFRFTHSSRYRVLQKGDNPARDHEYCRFVYGQHSSSIFVYSDQTAADLGLWKQQNDGIIARRVEELSGHKLFEVAKLIGYAPLPEWSK